MEKPSHVKFVLRSFTDDEITELLEAGGNFRELSTSWRDSLLQQMENGRWDTGNGECLAMDEDGRIVNGQHRLSAAQIYQRAHGDKVWFWVATGVRKNSDKSMDQGLNRTLSSLLRKEGVVNAPDCAALALSDYKMVASKSTSLIAMFSGGWQQKGKVSLPNTYDAWKRSSAAISEWAAISKSLEAAGMPRGGSLAAIGFQLAKKHPMDAKLFFSYLKDGAGMESGDPILLLRERLLEDRRTPQARMSQITMAALVVKAWVAWKSGTPLKVLKYIQLGPRAEKFPSHIVD